MEKSQIGAETGLLSQGPQAPSPSLSRGSCNVEISSPAAAAGLIIFHHQQHFSASVFLLYQICVSNVLFAAFVMTRDINSATTLTE